MAGLAAQPTEPWYGRPLDLPAHIHVPHLASPLATSTTTAHTAFENLTTAEFEAKSDVLRPHDERDLFALFPTLTAPQRSWLRESLGKVRSEHPWLAHLES